MTTPRTKTGRFTASRDELNRRRRSKHLHAKLAREVAAMRETKALPIIAFIEEHRGETA